jgi:hypothetical protein
MMLCKDRMHKLFYKLLLYKVVSTIDKKPVTVLQVKGISHLASVLIGQGLKGVALGSFYGVFVLQGTVGHLSRAGVRVVPLVI